MPELAMCTHFSPRPGAWSFRSGQSVAWRLALVALTGAGGCVSPTKRAKQEIVEIPGGVFVQGSTLQERADALNLSVEQSGELDAARYHWLAAERAAQTVNEPAFAIMRYPVTNVEYLRYVLSTGAPEPYVDPKTWANMSTGLDYSVVQSVLWQRGQPSNDRWRHPVVLVSQSDAQRYCKWWGQTHGGLGKLPSEAQWEKAARGDQGSLYPWGNIYDPRRLNASDSGPGKSSDVAAFDSGHSPYGVVDLAGNAFEWTATVEQDHGAIVKGGSFNTPGAFARGAARHHRPPGQRHIAIGFRCVLGDEPS